MLIFWLIEVCIICGINLGVSKPLCLILINLNLEGCMRKSSSVYRRGRSHDLQDTY
jgi:hypothetical protein